MTPAHTAAQSQATQYPISHHANILSDIYSPHNALACFCSPASWALSQAAKKCAAQHDGELLRYQGEIGQILREKIEAVFTNQTHSQLIAEHCFLMLEMFEALFEPKEIGMRILATRHSLSPAFHQSKMLVRMNSTLGGNGERWLTHQDATFHPLAPGQFVHEITPQAPNSVNHFCDGDIAVYKGNQWIGHEEHALINASPEFKGNDPRLSIYIDLLK